MNIELTAQEREARRLMKEACENKLSHIREIIAQVFIAKWQHAMTIDQIRRIGIAMNNFYDIDKDALENEIALLVSRGYLRERFLERGICFEVNY